MMAAPIPFARTQQLWYYMIPRLLLFLSFGYLFITFTDAEEYEIMLSTVLSYFFIMYCLHNLLASEHHKAIKILKNGDYNKAMAGFKKSADFFTKNAWIDKYRCVTLLSASKKCYREMALCNIGFCLTQTQRGAEAKALYEEILKEYPENDIAHSALNTLRSV